ncbi:MBL fold metallo-hydrolase [Bradyrhizobium diazoefficiens]|nr:MBL fold metallo-hydrolase [Bradyrhizobium diazoefficiens]QQO20608.1 MBL fold metallo-hydrolase [Bradyrhizobium diazoefficiens]
MLHRRKLLKLSTFGSLVSLMKMPLAHAQSKAKPRTRIVFLGTKGGPRVEIGRSNPANLIEINGTRVVLDCGMGVSHQMAQAKVPLPSVEYILISHHHSDHNLEYGNLVYNAWVAGLSTPIHSFGPNGLQRMTKTYWELNNFDVETRIADEGRPDPRSLLIAKDIDADGVVLKTDDFSITAFRTPHPPITDNFAYKFTTPDGVIVFSSDTEYNPRLAEFAKGADVLVHEALYAPFVDKIVARVKNGATLGKHLRASHTTAQDVGKIATAAGVKLLVLSHLVPGDIDVTDEQWISAVRENYSGKVSIAKDLMELTLPV